MKALNGPSILIVTSGSARLKSSGDTQMALGRGTVLFIPAHSDLFLETDKEELITFRAYCDPC